MRRAQGPREGEWLTKGVEIKRNLDALLDRLVHVPSSIHTDPLDRECVKPDPNSTTVPSPQRILQRADPAEVGPVELHSVGQDLHVVLDFLRGSSPWSQQDKAARDEEDDGRDVQVVSRVAKTYERSASPSAPQKATERAWRLLTALRFRDEPAQPPDLARIRNDAFEPDTAAATQSRRSALDVSQKEVVERVVGGVDEQRPVVDGKDQRLRFERDELDSFLEGERPIASEDSQLRWSVLA